MTALYGRILSRRAIVVVLLAALMAVLAPTGDAQAATTYTISGKVTLASGAPAAWLNGVYVRAYSGSSSIYADVDPATGNYTLTGVAPGSYEVAFRAGDYFDEATETIITPNLVDEYYNNSLSVTGATKVTVGTANRTGINAGLAIGKKISGKVTLPAGVPMAALDAVSVSAYADNDYGYGYAQVDPATGKYEVVGLASGSYTVEFNVNSYFDDVTYKEIYPNVANEFYNNSTTSAGATRVSVASGNAANINATLATGRTMSGKITIPAGAPSSWLNGVRVYTDNQDFFKSAKVDPATGNYTVVGLNPGTYTVNFYVTSYYDETAGKSVTPNLAEEYYNNSTTRAGAAKITVGSSNIASINAALGFGKLSSFTAAPVPTITGTAKVGSKVTANLGSWAPKPDSMSYEWFRDGVKISGATSYYYTLAAADAGHQVSVKVTAAKFGYASVGKASARVSVPWLTYTTIPAPTVTGTVKVGSKVTASVGTWSPAPSSFTYQWFRDGVKLSGATASQYTLTTADAGRQISVMATGAKAGYKSVGKASARVTVPWLTYTATPTPTITGTAKAGNKLTANLGTWSPKPDSMSYQWYRDGVKISGAVYYTYTLTASDKSHQVSVIVTAKKAGYKTVSKASSRTNVAG